METAPEPKAAPGATPLNPDQLQSDMNTITNVLNETAKNEDDVHRILVAVGNLVSGLLMLVVVPILLIAVGIVGIATPATEPGQPNPTLIVGMASILVIALVGLFALPFLLAAWGLFKKRSWGTAMAIIAGVLNLFNLPLGTALGIYTFWAAANGKLR